MPCFHCLLWITLCEVWPPLLAWVQAAVERHQDCEEDREPDAEGFPNDEEGAQTAAADGERHLPDGSPRSKNDCNCCSCDYCSSSSPRFLQFAGAQSLRVQ